MARESIEFRMDKVKKSIQKEELEIEEHKKNIKNLKVELKQLETEQEQSFMADVLKLMRAKGISQADVLQSLAKTETKNYEAENSDPVLSSTDLNTSSAFTSEVRSASNFSR